MAQGFSIKMFIPDGNSNGLRIIGKSHWTGQGVVFNRSIYNDVKKRHEFTRPGVYVLVGDNEFGMLPKIYIGEAENILLRMQQHYAKKEFWNWCIFFTSSVDGGLNKVGVKYLESRLIELAIEAKLCLLDNDQNSKIPVLSEADIADAEAFLVDMLDIYPLVGLEIFRKVQRPKSKNKLHISGSKISGTGYESSDGFIVCKGTTVNKNNSKSVHNFIIVKRNELIKQKVIIDNGDNWIFAQDYPFSSPSTASGVILGRSSNGRTTWKDKDGKTLKEIQEQRAQKKA